MANMFFPQLSTGALTQYPVRRTKLVHTVGEQAEDGSFITYFDPNGTTLQWMLTYAGLTQGEADKLQGLFESCCGRLRAFTFIDPLANLLKSQWLAGPAVQAQGALFTNTGSAVAEVSQTLAVPAGYVYCFSVPGQASADPTASLTLVRRGPNQQETRTHPLNQPLLVTAGALADSGTTFTVAVQLRPGQSIDLGQAQLEAQPAPSLARPQTGGVYPQAHWAVDELLFTATGPDSFDSKFVIETHI